MIVTHLGPLAHRCYHPKSRNKYCVTEGEAPKPSVSVCETCGLRIEQDDQPPGYKPTDEWTYRSVADLVTDALELCKHVPHDCRGICGVARSGLMPAAAISAHMHLPLFEVSKKGGLNPIGAGYRFDERQKEVEDKGPLFVVDDSVHDGNTMWLIRNILPKNVIMSAVYARPEMAHVVDHYVTAASSPHLFEWNIMNTLMMAPLRETGIMDPFLGEGLALDFDGIISIDPKKFDDRADNLDWLANLRPGKYVPRRCVVPLIATNRLEKWREETEKWCKKWGVAYEKMVMSPYETAEERDADFPESAIKVKGVAYRESDCNLFVESDPFQADLIHQFTGKPVLCPQSHQLFLRSATHPVPAS